MTALDPRTPIIVGVGVATQRPERVEDGVEATALMRVATEHALADCGAPQLGDRIDACLVPEGIWSYPDPGRLVLDGRSPGARTLLAAVGVLQQTLFSRGATDIASGRCEAVLICGAETMWSTRAFASSGVGIPVTTQGDDVHPEVRLDPADEIITDVEIHRGLAVPAHQYAVIESARRAALRRSPEDHATAVAEGVARLSSVAAANPDAWIRTPMSTAEVLAAPMIATPYTRPSISQWTVDQAAASIMTSVGTAERLGIPRDRWVFAVLGVESNLMVPLTERALMGRSPAMAAAAAGARSAGVDLAAADLLEIYSCFPAAVSVQCEELGIEPGRQLSVTGGMHFAGGPLNSFSLQAMSMMVDQLREGAGATALVTSISGMITKFGAGTWSTAPPQRPFRSLDVSDEAGRRTARVAVDPDYAGRSVIAGWTVGHTRGVPAEAVVVCDTPDGMRAVATSTDPDLAAALTAGEWVGRTVEVRGPLLLG